MDSPTILVDDLLLFRPRSMDSMYETIILIDNEPMVLVYQCFDKPLGNNVWQI